jgi:hypothetical protein
MKYRIYFFSLLIIASAGFVIGSEVPKNNFAKDNQTIPEAWIGSWEVTVDYRDRQTGALLTTDVTTDEICPGEPIIPPQLATLVHCSSEAAMGDLNISCHNWHKTIPGSGCNAFGDLEFTSQLDGDSWTGAGSWSAKSVGKCTHANYVEDFVVSAKRISTKTSCDRGSSSLVEKFFLHNRLVPFLAGSN